MLSALLGLGFLVAVGFVPMHILANEKSPAYKNLVHKFAYRYDLHVMDVKAVLAAVKDERFQSLKLKLESKLAQAVQDGVLTESRKTELLSKMDLRLNSYLLSMERS